MKLSRIVWTHFTIRNCLDYLTLLVLLEILTIKDPSIHFLLESSSARRSRRRKRNRIIATIEHELERSSSLPPHHLPLLQAHYYVE